MSEELVNMYSEGVEDSASGTATSRGIVVLENLRAMQTRLPLTRPLSVAIHARPGSADAQALNLEAAMRTARSGGIPLSAKLDELVVERKASEAADREDWSAFNAALNFEAAGRTPREGDEIIQKNILTKFIVQKCKVAEKDKIDGAIFSLHQAQQQLIPNKYIFQKYVS